MGRADDEIPCRREGQHALPTGSVAVVLGTRPEVVKLAGLLDLLGPAARTVHTGQHWAPDLAGSFRAGLGGGRPDVQLSVGGTTRGRQVGEALVAIEAELLARPACAVVVQGDTNAALAGALAANAVGAPLLHVEAGLRSFDRAMPEEHNRVVVDHLSDAWCAPTDTSRANLAAEGITGSRVIVTGNTVVEAVLRLRPDREAVRAELEREGLEPERFVLATLHRPENVDDLEVLRTVLEELAALPLPVVLPVHPRTAARARDGGLTALLGRLHTLPPASYPSFLALAASCAVLVSDSGGVQEEASVLKRPVVVVRRSTERPEVLGTFCELVRPGPAIGAAVRARLDELPELLARLTATPSPYGDGSASQRTMEALLDLLADRW